MKQWKRSRQYFFTSKDKECILSRLQDEIKKKRIDKRIVPFLVAFNKGKNVVSDFCCWGHGMRKSKPISDLPRPAGGYLSFFAKGKVHEKFLDLSEREQENLDDCVSLDHLMLFPASSIKWKDSRFRWCVRWYSRDGRDKVIRALLSGKLDLW